MYLDIKLQQANFVWLNCLETEMQEKRYMSVISWLKY